MQTWLTYLQTCELVFLYLKALGAICGFCFLGWWGGVGLAGRQCCTSKHKHASVNVWSTCCGSVPNLIADWDHRTCVFAVAGGARPAARSQVFDGWLQKPVLLETEDTYLWSLQFEWRFGRDGGRLTVVACPLLAASDREQDCVM